jgi:hypothetical protein
MSTTALRKRSQPPSRLGKKLGARRFGDNLTNTAANGNGSDKKFSKGKKSVSSFDSSNNNNKGNADSWDAWESWTDTATKTFNGVTKLVTEESPNLSSPLLETKGGMGRGSHASAQALMHNGNVISTTADASSTSISRDISALKKQSFKAFSSLSKVANSFAQAVEETIDGSIKEVSRLVQVPVAGSSPREGARSYRSPTSNMNNMNMGGSSSSTSSFSSPSQHAIYTSISNTMGARDEGKRGKALSRGPSPFGAASSANRRTSSGSYTVSPLAAADQDSENKCSPSGAHSATRKPRGVVEENGSGNGRNQNTVEYFGQLWTRELGEILNGFNHPSMLGGSSSQSPDNKEVLERLHKKAIESQSELEHKKQEFIASQLEKKKLQSKNSKLEKHIHKFQNECETLKKQNGALKEQVDTVQTSQDMASLQLSKQLQILLAEKAKLQSENQRLLSENDGLQELLSYAAAGPMEDDHHHHQHLEECLTHHSDVPFLSS